MPSDQENIQFLYLIHTHGSAPTVDWDPICTALGLERGAVSKRWSRLQRAMEHGDRPSDSSFEFLWLMLKHSPLDRKYDWEAIAEICNSTKGACSKRYSRLKIALERGDPMPATSSKANKFASVTPKKTPSKSGANIEKDVEGTPTTTPRRKRLPTKRKLDFSAAGENDEKNEKPKRAKSTPKNKPRPKNAFRASDEKQPSELQTIVKGEPVDDDGDFFTHALVQSPADAGAQSEPDEVLPISVFSEKFTHARDMANALLNRKTRLANEQRKEVEKMLDVFDEAV